MDRTEMARRRLAELTDVEERLVIIHKADLGDELVQMLPLLTEAGACSFTAYNTQCDKFAVEGIEPDHNHLFVWLEIHVGTTHVSVNFAGLMRQFATPDKAAEIVKAILKKKLGFGGDYSAALQVQMSAGDAFAMRTHDPSSTLRDCVELSVIYHALKGEVAVGVALGLIPGSHTTHRVPAEQQLLPVAVYLQEDVGVAQIVIDEMIELLFKETAALTSLDKVVALAAIYNGSKSMTRAHLLRRQFTRILGLHFANRGPFVRSTNMDWLVNHGLFVPLILEASGPAREVFEEALVHELAQGRLVAVFQFLLTFMKKSGLRKDPPLPAEQAKAYVVSLLPRAFELAMTDRRYGTAAAIAQICDTVPNDDRIRALELAFVYDQRIRIESVFYALR